MIPLWMFICSSYKVYPSRAQSLERQFLQIRILDAISIKYQQYYIVKRVLLYLTNCFRINLLFNFWLLSLEYCNCQNVWIPSARVFTLIWIFFSLSICFFFFSYINSLASYLILNWIPCRTHDSSSILELRENGKNNCHHSNFLCLFLTLSVSSHRWYI